MPKTCSNQEPSPNQCDSCCRPSVSVYLTIPDPSRGMLCLGVSTRLCDREFTCRDAVELDRESLLEPDVPEADGR